jgi:intraflagellar transport protein 88
MKMLESSIHQIIEESIVAHSKEEFRVALDKAKEAVNKERSLIRQKEQSGMGESNSDIAFMVITICALICFKTFAIPLLFTNTKNFPINRCCST